MNQNNIRTKVVNAFAVFMVMLILYFIVGLFTVINQQFQIPLQTAMLPHDGNITNALVTMLNFSWFLAYPLSEGFGTRWLEKYGYRKTSFLALLILVTGLAIYEAAVLFHIYTPVRISILGNQISLGFFIFLIGSFVIGMAATVLQVVLNLYLAVCQIGKTTALQRQMIGGTSNSIGMAVAPLVISYLIFYGTPLHDIRTEQFVVPLIILILLMLVITFFVNRTQMPSIDNIRQGPGETLEKSVWSFRHLKLGVWGIFFYVGIEVAVGANINMYASELGGTFATNATHMAALYWGLLLLGRFLGSFIKKVPSEKQLVIASIGAIALLIFAMIAANPWVLTGIGFFHSIMWPAIFTLAIDKLGKYTTKASGVLTMGVVGGGIIPFLQGIFADLLDGNWRWTWLLVIAGEVYILYYGINGYKLKTKGQEG
ncbi:MFS transporter [uncultured Parabacteroides sp.]|uniref:MFS transporter n=1 Tax=uncultured Parabacteroides sp. TaxID=512312 RepID=UPI0028057195|nr:MFS transporter [uncultured Parabacteroides sp.]